MTMAPGRASRSGRQIAFDTAVKIALDYAHSHPDTLVIVTSDHAHTS
jgi:alkaline phosphatase